MVEDFGPSIHAYHLGAVLRVVLPISKPLLECFTVYGRSSCKVQDFLSIHVKDVPTLIDIV